MGKKACIQFAKRGSCRFSPCRFDHGSQNELQTSNNWSTGEGARKTTEFNEFNAWKRLVSSSQRNHPLGSQLGPFFAKARGLLGIDEDTLQSVIRCLSEEGGLRRVVELIQRDFALLSKPLKKNLFQEATIPFLEIITLPNVLSSLVLEQAVVTIYNCVFGPAGRRGEPFLCFLLDAVQLEIENDGVSALVHLELSLLAFTQIVELNSNAFILESLQPVAQRFAELLMTIHALDSTCALHQSYHYLEQLQRRLDIGLSLPNLTGASKKLPTSQATATFVTQKDPPGGRHNNDHMNICDIEIMPTFEEICCSKSEYLPVKDPRQWHLGGLGGLLDRNFRLLREDTIGQLRDAIHAELQPDRFTSNSKNQTRIHVYKQATVQGVEFHRFAGFQFLVRFAQPQNMRGMAKKKLKEWWELSKRLQPGALVCIVDPQGVATFCTVANPDRPNMRSRASQSQQTRNPGSLSDNSSIASIMLELVEPTEINRQYVLDFHALRKNRPSVSLVEFPGILLSAFQPTLLGLQKMQKARDLPMSEFLAPNDFRSLSVLDDVPPPVYATAPGFSFDLKCLMKDGSGLIIQHSQPVDLERLRQKSTLDDAQASALVRTLQRRIGLIQGPPGTGKSFTGVALIKVLLANKAKVRKGLGPIICVCYTNHALDQLLEELLEHNITSQIIRIGSQSKSERLQSLNLRAVARDIERTRLEKRQQWQLHESLDRQENEFRKLYMNDLGSGISLQYYLQKNHPSHFDQLFGEDEDGFQRQPGKGSNKIISSWLNSGQPSHTQPRRLEDLRRSHVNTMSAEERRILFNYWLEKQKKMLHAQAQMTFSEHLETKASWDELRQELDLRSLRDADVIGVTTSGLARNLNMLRRLRSKVIMCEEAGEVLEAHLLVSILPSIEHVILIGDHQQLRPQIQNHDLSREKSSGQKYSLDKSLFERLIEPDDGVGVQLPFCTLETQRRMHPSISRLIRDTLYPRLQDSPVVFEYPEVAGTRRRLFWLDHRHLEGGASSQDATATSHWNEHEVDLTVALVNHLLRQGVYRAGEIAVLTPYLGQLHRLRRTLAQSFTITLGERDQEGLENAGFVTDENQEFNKEPVSKSSFLQALRVATIDNFQGEEAKVVVISLVRSNSQNRCGFLRTPNRINVLLSRAKHGMYIIGNSLTSRSVEMWRKVLEIMDTDGNIGPKLELSCPRHPETPIIVSEPDHFVQLSPEGGCSLQCGKRLECGHPCKQKCHSEMLHNAVYCSEPCPRLQKKCAHPCSKPCGDKCPTKCTVPVFDAERFLPCGHLMATLPCWQAQDLSTVKCSTLVTKQNLQCNHKVAVSCHIDVESIEYQCKCICQSVLSCGHSCKRQCSTCTTRTAEGVEVDHEVCTQRCGRPYSTCSHSCSDNCHGDLPCSSCEAPCEVQCGHSKCPQKCSEPCAPCAVPICLSSCPHSSCSMPCSAPCNHIPCSLRCEKILKCGHQCPSVCGEACPPEKFCQTCGSDEIQHTPVDFILGETYREIDLTENPCIFPQCGHFLTIENMDAQMDLRSHYNMDDMGRPVSLASSSQPFSIGDIRSCATCRGSLRSLSRYGRLIRRALLDEWTKKFILYVNQQYVPLAQRLPTCLSELYARRGTSALATKIFQANVKFRIEGPGEHQVQLMSVHINRGDKERWKGLLDLRRKITEYKNKVKVEEQPFQRVHNMVENARRREISLGQFEFDENVLQSKGYLQAFSLLVRLDTALLSDFLSLKKQARVGSSQTILHVNLSENRKESRMLIGDATSSQRVLQQAEGNIFLAQLCALERLSDTDPAKAAMLLEEANMALAETERLCGLYPGQTRGLVEEIEGTRGMLLGETFYTPVTNEERMAVLAAMSREFRGTGHWYYCENGHPFTIGECGGAMEVSKCPECGAPVGGQHHQTATGVTRANDLEERMQEIHL